MLKGAGGLRGYNVLVADRAGPEAKVVELGEEQTVRGAKNGLLLGVNPVGETVGPDAKLRYGRLQGLAADERIIASKEIEEFLCDVEPNRTGQGTIFNEFTRYCVVFEPKALRMRVAFTTDDGRPGVFADVAFDAEAP